MLIRCPTCASGYDLPAHLLSDGRILRCAHCRDAWAHRAAASDASPGRPALVVEARSARRAIAAPPPCEPRPGRRFGSPRIGASAASAVLLVASVAAAMAAVGQRERIVAAFRPSAAAFATLGLPVNLRGLAFGDIRSTIGSGDGSSTLTLDGTVTNLRRQATAVPAIRIAVCDAAQRELYYWTAPAPKGLLAAGETVPFHSRLAGPPHDGQTLAISFSDAPAAPRHLAEASPAAR